MSRKELENIRSLKYEIRKLKAKLHEIESRSLVASPIPGECHGSGTADKVALNVQRKLELEQELSDKLSQLHERMDFIRAIPDDVMREVVLCQCVYKFSWRETAQKVTGNNDSDSVRKLYDRFMGRL